jgi:ribosomal protection tetracycline resistance protein
LETVNIGIVAHVDAGKTSLTERLLYDAGVIGTLGSVDAGTTQTDTGEIERRRGITIRSAVVAFRAGDRQVNLIDTPGHSDFVAEVERALGVLDGAVLVLSAVEGVQPHTRRLARILRALRLPTILFVNKVDRRGARADDLVADIRRLLTPHVAPLCSVRGLGTAAVTVPGHKHSDPADRTALATVLADHDDALLADLVDGITPEAGRLRSVLRRQVAAGLTYPLLFGSAVTGAGVAALAEAVATLLPAAPPAEAALRGRIFAIERAPGGEKLAYVRSYGGELGARQRVALYRRDPDGRIDTLRARTADVEVVGPGTGPRLTAGHIARVRGLADARIGDQVGSPAGLAAREWFAPPSLETVVRPVHRADAGPLHAALVQLADADPLIATRALGGGQSAVLLYGEVQKEVIGATLAETYGIEAVFAPTTVVHLERPVGVGRWFEPLTSVLDACVGLRVEPGAPGSGVAYRLEVERGMLVWPFHRAIEEAVFRALEQGVHGWPVTDIVVSLTACDKSPGSTAAFFRQLTPMVLMHALARARTRVYEPCHRFTVEVPGDRLGPVSARLAQLEAIIETTAESPAGWVLGGGIPARTVPTIQRELPGLSRGEGVWTSQPGGDRPVTGRPPTRRRTDGNPFDRTEYLRFLAQPALAG